MFADDAPTFLLDDGLQVTWTPSTGGAAVTGLMLLDQDDETVDTNQVISRQYLVTFQTSGWPGLKRAEVLAIQMPSGTTVNFKLRTDPLFEQDGVFSKATLTKV